MSPRFRPGDVVTVRRAYPPGRLRAPRCIRGKAGVRDSMIDVSVSA